jgi:hypothetical protein
MWKPVTPWSDEHPTDNTLIEVMFDDGTRTIGPACDYEFDYREGGDNIVAWRHSKIKSDGIVEYVCNKMRLRSEAGIKKYGTTLYESKADIIARLNHLQEELMDGANYVEWVIREMRK